MRLSVLRRAALTAALAAGFVSSSLGAETIRVYTASQPELLTLYKEAFEARHPDIEITFLRDSASPIVARLLAERNAPQADVVHALSVIGLETLAAEGVLTPYRPKDAEALDSRFLSKDSMWVGINAWGSAICLNEELLERQNLPIPKHWTDLADPVYRGKIAMPHPVSSSTGYMILLGWLELFGEEKTWDFVKALHENMLFYTFSGSRPISMVAQGEIAVGLSSNAFTKPYRNPKIPLKVVEPEEGIGWDAEGSALVAGTKHPEAAKAFLDFCAGEEVARIAADFSGIAAREDFSTQEGRETLEHMIPMNFLNAAQRKNEILQKWQETVGER